MPDTTVGHFYLYMKPNTVTRIKNISKVILILITQNHLTTNAY